jgi:long-chain acyl-CoA synthetase
VEVDGEYMRILGRKSEIINVGGEKVCPAKIERTISQPSNIAEATVFG